MMKYLAFAALLAIPAAATAADFSEGSEARSWNLYAESPAKFEATVVDITCEVTGDCAENCGDGTRQLGLLRAADGVLVFPNKNNQTGFQGAVVDLLPFCGQSVTVDGLLIEDPDIPGATNIYQVQTIAADGAEPVKARNWTKAWEAANPDAGGKGPWFRRDPRVNAIIADSGHLGLGLEIDEAFKKELFE
ncbi:hypothetical protein C8N43_0236 [Litoreibacter ponti]|uniref:Uncharacterized protein n=1 Tax=Litoreibacter ponti TaxID=1510457 RepID=A0A2T6BHQ9_9RHOB|nr:hypothetical protein [Litoreibacter ponti]PTX55597.1 hypothetical protein C8N43_0236 [Litoreibacter ponti]